MIIIRIGLGLGIINQNKVKNCKIVEIVEITIILLLIFENSRIIESFY